MSEENKKEQDKLFDELSDKLSYSRKNILKKDDAENEKEARNAFAKKYIDFLNAAKTEREAVKYITRELRDAGFKEFSPTEKYKAGDKVFALNRGKALSAAVIGEKSSDDGFSLLAAHIDSPRLDLKQVPLYEANELALLKTHYYGGIKKYQWTATPLALIGVIVKANGEKVEVNIGLGEDDPVFVVTDLLPHLSQEQNKRTGDNLIKGEELNILIGSEPHKFASDKKSEAVKLNILSILNEKYDIVEADFLSAELSAVPAFKAAEVGFDRSLIGGYGQDDRVCAFIQLQSLLELKTPEYTAVAIFADKEETGSDGNTGIGGRWLEYFAADLTECTGGKNTRTTLSNSLCLSADVNAAFDPTFPDVLEKNNAVYIGKGTAVTKFTGSRGKYGTSDATAETVAEVRGIFDKAGVIWQTGELGKVDLGGGGTVAMYIARLGVDTIDVGVPVLSMHSPFEIASKADIYETFKAFNAFYTRNPKK